MLGITVCVATFGNYKWQLLAQERAIPAAKALEVPVIYVHGETLHGARNDCLEQTKTEFIMYCDADDELDSEFFKHMEKVDGDLRPPSVNHVHENVTFMPRVVGLNGVHNHICKADCLSDGNWLCVGTVARTELLKEVGGWKDWPTWEDWDLWTRCWLAGANITPVPKAIYKAYSTSEGRCKFLSEQESRKVYHDIRKANFPELYS